MLPLLPLLYFRNFPCNGYVKLDTDVVAFGNPEYGGGGDVLCDSRGILARGLHGKVGDL